ncbi:MAG TPA: HAD family phosphatase [Vicinamibacterales bacterium]|nr:HAD family phosphatase [Vicinamibacterales bacterium]
MTPAAPSPYAVVFDFDGVLADTERLHLRAYQHVFGKRGWTLGEREYFDQYLGYDDAYLFETFAANRGLALDAATRGDLFREKVDAFAALVANGQALFPGAADCVRALADRFALAIASGSLHEEIVRVIEPAALAPYFPVIVGADDVARSKPAPDPYLEAVKRLGVPSSAAVAVEDSRWGLFAARTAGLRCIGITTSYPASELPDAEIVINAIGQLTPALVEALLSRA